MPRMVGIVKALADCADPAPDHGKPQSPEPREGIRASLHLGEAYSDAPRRDPHSR